MLLRWVIAGAVSTVSAISNSSNSSISSNSSNSSNSSIPKNYIPDESTWGVYQLPNVLNDSAVDANQVAEGYKLLNISRTPCGIEGTLRINKKSDIYGYDYDLLHLSVEHQKDTRLAVHIAPKNKSSVYELPSKLVEKPTAGNKTCGPAHNSKLVFRHSGVNESFWFEVVRAENGDVVFSTKNNPLVFANQFVQLNTSLPNGHVILGLGESIKGLTNPPGTVRTLYANDQPDPEGRNIYGVHPFYMDQRFANLSETNLNTPPANVSLLPGIHWGNVSANGTLLGRNSTLVNSTALHAGKPFKKSYSHGVYWRTSAPQEVVVEEESLTWRALNGVVDLYFFAGPTPKDVMLQYVQEIGLPALQPYWALGYHQCRWGYDSVEALEEVVDKFHQFDLPLETVWLDIDYMDSYRDFTSDPNRYPKKKFLEFLEKLHNNSQHYVPIVDAAIYHPNPNNETDQKYLVFFDGQDQDVFLKNPDGSLYIGAVWPGYSVFPDFLANNTYSWWKDALEDWRDNVQYDGIWLDMNEALSFCVGSCGSGNLEKNPVLLPGVIGGVSQYPEHFNVTNRTAYDAFIRAGNYSNTTINTPANLTVIYRNITDLYKNVSTPVNYPNVKLPGKGNVNYPPYVLNHDQPGADLAVHAVSPNATHSDGTLEYEIHNLYGFLQTNATYHALREITPQKRPFIISRSTFAGSGAYAGHWGGDNWSNFTYAAYSIPQALTLGLSGIPFFGVDVCGFNGNSDLELCSRWMQLGAFFPFYRNHNILGAISQEPYVWDDVLTASKTAMNIRYSLLPYYYTLLAEAHSTGVPVLRALSWEFPDDPTLSDIDRQFFVGEALLVTPVLDPGVSEVNGTFPGANDTDVYYDWYTLEKQNFTAGKNHSLKAPLGHIPLHVRGGHVIPLQDPAYTVAESRNGSWSLLVALDNDGKASGRLYSDDGESVHVNKSITVDFVASHGHLSASAIGKYSLDQPLANVTILGVDKKPKHVKFGNESASYDYVNRSVVVTDLEKFTEKGAFAKDFRLDWS